MLFALSRHLPAPAMQRALRFGVACLCAVVGDRAIRAQELPTEAAPVKIASHATLAQPFFKAHCTRCHGADKVKGDVTLHSFGGGPDTGHDLERWELVLDVLRSGEMPPEDEDQPPIVDRARVVTWIDSGLRAAVASRGEAIVPTTRRLTNFEYHNTLRDLLGIELELTENLPEDPSRPYQFQNSARFLLMGLEQVDRYEENARKAMASVIVAPEQPEVLRTKQSWAQATTRGLTDSTNMQRDEVGVFGNRNRTVVNGMRVFQWPATGTFRIRVKASAILPAGVEEMPLAILMGHDIVGVGVSGLSPARRVGTLRLSDRVDEPQVYELTGRIENFPSKPEHRYRRGGKIDGRLVVTAPHFTITPVNAYDDGTLNDRPDPLTKPRAVVEWLEFEAPVSDSWPPEHHTRILFDSPLRASNPKAYVAAVLERFLPRAFRRPVRPGEVARFTKIYEIVSEQLGLKTMEEAMRETLAMVLISPEFLYHRNGAADAQYELASRLSYFLWGSMPDAELFRLAKQGKLQDRNVLAQQAQRLLADDRATDFVESFATQWLALTKMRAVPIDLQRFPRFLYTIARGERRGQEVPNRSTVRDAMHAETVAFVAELINRNASLLQIVDSDFAMLNQRLAVHYGVAGVQGHELRPVPVEPHHHLGGLLTQGSFLVGTSTGAAPHPVYRAVWLREAILGDEVPEPPADVPALDESAIENATQAITLKDLLRLHRSKQSCRECHARLDPWGIPFEQYDATGRFQSRVPPPGSKVQGFDLAQHRDLSGYREYLNGLSTAKVEASAQLPRGPLVASVAELKRYLLEQRHQDIAENVVRRLLTYALGRELTYRDRYVVEQLLHDSEQNGYKLRDLIVAICQTGLFTGSSIK
ncbi:MAG: mono/diheme cytochrome c family protein [Neolewinella sp.]|jgi:mono/diheme cytochrome c family protein